MNVITSRDEARQLGLKRYFTGQACKYGHVAERYITNKACVACDYATCRSDRNQKVYPSVIARYAKSDKGKATKARYRLRNRGECNAHNARYRAAKLRATPAWANSETIASIYKNCPPGYHVDHHYPLQGETVCGLHVETNLKYLLASDNLSKSNKLVSR